MRAFKKPASQKNLRWIKKTNHFILDILFPIFCLSCQKESEWLCNECFSKINFLDFQVCPFCEKQLSPDGKICPSCQEKFLRKKQAPPLDTLIVAASYKNPLLSKGIHLLKYRFVRELGEVLGKICQNSFKKSSLPLPDLIIPIPLHPKRLRWRGFNQSALIANYVAQNICPGLPLPVASDLIVRQRYTPPQMKIKNYQERKNNLLGAFILNPKISTLNLDEEIRNKTILIVDDVATTGATLFELGKLLKDNGAKKVYGLVAARQEINT